MLAGTEMSPRRQKIGSVEVLHFPTLIVQFDDWLVYERHIRVIHSHFAMNRQGDMILPGLMSSGTKLTIDTL